MLWMEWRERKFLRTARCCGEYEVVVMFGMGMRVSDGELWILGPRRGMRIGRGGWLVVYVRSD